MSPLVNGEKPKLPLHEWIIVLLFCFILLLLAGFALGRPKAQPPYIEPPPLKFNPISFQKPKKATALQVKIEGEVTYPGHYRLPLHATVKELLEQAEPLASADLSQLHWRRRLRQDQTVRIPKRHLITIQISGAVKHQGPLEIFSGTRFCELADQLTVLPDADLKAMRKKRSFVQEGAHIEIPFQKKSKKKLS